MLSDAELERSKSLKCQHKEKYIFERGKLRSLLARHIGCNASEINILRSSKGKPYLGSDQHKGWHFSLSHSDKLFAIAISNTGKIGVDIDSSLRSNHFEKIAKHYFSADEQLLLSEIRKSSESEFNNCFMRLWTLKESVGKLMGEGLNKNLLKNALTIVDKGIELNKDWLAKQVNGSTSYQSFQLPPYFLSIVFESEIPTDIQIYDSESKWLQIT